MFAYIDDVFKHNGMPDEIEISDRYIFAGISKTLKKLNISTIFLREENEFAKGCYQNLGEVLEKLDFLNKTFESMNDVESEEEFIQKLEENSNELYDLEDENYDYEEEFLNEETDNSFVA
jgi:hypothetical protein